MRLQNATYMSFITKHTTLVETLRDNTYTENHTLEENHPSQLQDRRQTSISLLSAHNREVHNKLKPQ